MSDLLVTLRAALDRRAQLLAEIAVIDQDLAGVRELLGLEGSSVLSAESPTTVPAAATSLAAAAPVSTNALPAGPMTKTCAVCRHDFVPASPRQRMCANCRRGAPHRKTEHIARRRGVIVDVADADLRTCELPACGKRFIPEPGSAGRFCSRACFTASVRRGLIAEGAETSSPPASATAAPPGPTDDFPTFIDVVNTAKLVAATNGHELRDTMFNEQEGCFTSCGRCGADAVVDRDGGRPVFSGKATKFRCKAVKPIEPGSPLPERRCGRCLHKFRPKSETQYICDNCLKKPLKKKRAGEPELETVWRPGRNAPSLTPWPVDDAGRGSPLVGADFKDPRR